MSQFGKFIAVVALMLSGCAPRRGTASPEDYYASAKLSLEGGRVAAMIGRNQSLAEKNFVGCVVGDVTAAALKSGQEALRGKLSESPVIPSFDLDLKDCMTLRGAETLPADDEVAALVESVVGVSLLAARHYAEKLKGVDCRKGAAVIAVVDYVSRVAEPLMAELTEPDGVVSVGAVEIDLASCKAL
jgi:hypothetical protein